MPDLYQLLLPVVMRFFSSWGHVACRAIWYGRPPSFKYNPLNSQRSPFNSPRRHFFSLLFYLNMIISPVQILAVACNYWRIVCWLCSLSFTCSVFSLGQLAFLWLAASHKSSMSPGWQLIVRRSEARDVKQCSVQTALISFFMPSSPCQLKFLFFMFLHSGLKFHFWRGFHNGHDTSGL